MRGWRVQIAVLGLVCSALPVCVATAAEPPKIYAAVLGQVSRPGTYELSQGDVNELLTAAGGLTAESSRNVRIIRNGRGMTKVYVSPSVSYPLRDGDVILAESGNATSGLSRLARTPNAAVVTGRTAKSDQEIVLRTTFAAVGLQPWPTVLSLPSDQCSAQAFLRSVNHPPRGKVTVVNSYGVPIVEEVAEKAIPIAPDSVIVLPKGLIDASMLPPLPEPQRAMPPIVSPRAPAAPPPPLAPEPLEAEAVIASTSPRLPRVEAIPVPPPEPPIEIEPETAPAEESPAVVDSTPTPAEAIPQPHERRPVEAAGSWWIRVRTPVVFVGATAVFLAILTALSSLGRQPAKRSAATAAATAVEPAAMPASALLIDQLIRNELPIVEERLEFPAGIALHGLPAGSTQRTDAAQPLAEPHFPAEATPRLQPAVAAGKRSVRVDRSSEPRRGALDRALAAVNKDER